MVTLPNDIEQITMCEYILHGYYSKLLTLQMEMENECNFTISMQQKQIDVLLKIPSCNFTNKYILDIGNCAIIYNKLLSDIYFFVKW